MQKDLRRNVMIVTNGRKYFFHSYYFLFFLYQKDLNTYYVYLYSFRCRNVCKTGLSVVFMENTCNFTCMPNLPIRTSAEKRAYHESIIANTICFF